VGMMHGVGREMKARMRTDLHAAMRKAALGRFGLSGGWKAATDNLDFSKPRCYGWSTNDPKPARLGHKGVVSEWRLSVWCVPQAVSSLPTPQPPVGLRLLRRRSARAFLSITADIMSVEKCEDL